MLVDTLDQDIGLARGFRSDAFRQFVLDRMREAEGQRQDLTFSLGTVADADQLQLALEAFADAHNHVVDQGAGGTGHGTILLIAMARSKAQLTGFMNHFNRRMHLQFQSALGTLHRELLAGQLNFDTGGQLDGVLSNARHADPPLEYGAEHFATDTGSASSTIRHHTLVGGDDGNAEAAANFRQLLNSLVLAQTGTAHALELFDDRLAFEILQLDGQLLLDVAADLEIRNVAFVLEDFGDCCLQLGRRHANHGLLSHLGITDTS
ncbi:hypothetical protein D3C81_1456320 [compost metagenome]